MYVARRGTHAGAGDREPVLPRRAQRLCTGDVPRGDAGERPAGIVDDRIILDPGIGFGKTVEQNLELVARFHAFRDLGFPVLAGPSRKSFIGYTLDLPADQRAEGTAAVVALCIDRGADIVRVHDVGLISRVARMTDAVVRRRLAPA